MYSRTQNDNGTYNTRCLDCFMTIASCVESPKDLDQLEARHICPEKALHRLQEIESGNRVPEIEQPSHGAVHAHK